MRYTEKAMEALKRILEAFESGDVPKLLSHLIIPPLDVPCAHWSLSNRLLVFLSGTDDARGFRQWEEVGRHVRSGARALYILAPILVRKRNEEEDSEEEKVLKGFRVVPVFRVEDTEGEPLNHPPLHPPQPPPLLEVAQTWGIRVDYRAIESPVLGSYSPERKQIVLCTHDEQTFFHELAHAAHEKVLGALKRGQDWKQEITAELTAATLMHLFGKRPNDGWSYRYISDYAEKAGKDVYRACLAVIADVEKCLSLIIGAARPLAQAA
jgi:hypothetical protein